MPNAVNNFSGEAFVDDLIAFNRLFVFFFSHEGRSIKSSYLRLYISSTFSISLFSNKVSTVSLPSPSISRPDLDPKKIIASFFAKLQDCPPSHLGTFSSSINSIENSPHGHFLGSSHFFWLPSLLSLSEETTSGITSPARRTIT